MADLAGGSLVIWTRRLTCSATVALLVLARDEGRRRGDGGGAPPACAGEDDGDDAGEVDGALQEICQLVTSTIGH